MVARYEKRPERAPFIVAGSVQGFQRAVAFHVGLGSGINQTGHGGMKHHLRKALVAQANLRPGPPAVGTAEHPGRKCSGQHHSAFMQIESHHLAALARGAVAVEIGIAADGVPGFPVVLRKVDIAEKFAIAGLARCPQKPSGVMRVDDEALHAVVVTKCHPTVQRAPRSPGIDAAEDSRHIAPGINPRRVCRMGNQPCDITAATKRCGLP